MEYLMVRWLHANPSDPILLMSELDMNRYEVRKVELFADGRLEFASAEISSDEAVLGEKPVPATSEIAADPQFVVVQRFDSQDFERAWIAAVSGTP